MHTKKILIMGLPGTGKTTLAQALVPKLNAVWFNADDVRQNITYHLGFSQEDRIQQAKTMKWLSDKVVESGHVAVVDFVCPTPATREAFQIDDAFVVWVDRIESGRFEDTNKMFIPPEKYDVRVLKEGTAEHWAEVIVKQFLQ
jgi:adenylylsulfate kinase-like enzyme